MLKIELLPQPYHPTLNSLLATIPENTFVDKRYTLAPYSTDKTSIKITSDSIDRIITIKVQNRNPSLKLNPIRETTVHLMNLTQVVNVDLDEGHNFIYVSSNGETDYLIINCRRYIGILDAFSREYYNNTKSLLDEQNAAISNKYATRLAEPLLSKVFYLFPNVRSLQLLSLRLFIKTIVEKSCTEIGVLETAGALTLNTPIMSYNESSHELELTRFPLLSYSEAFSKLAHIWIPNTDMIRWKAFLVFIENVSGYEFVDISENEIIIKDPNGQIQRHVFNFEQKSYFTNSRFNPDIVIKVRSSLPIFFIAPAYPMDMFVDEYHLLGNDRRYLDMDIPLDSGLTWDAETIDPLHDGYLGMSLIDRNELSPNYTNLGYDTSLAPVYGSAIPMLVYSKGFYGKVVDIESIFAETSAKPTLSGTYD